MKKYPLVVIGAGAGGLVVAIGAAKAGKKVLLIEKGNYGGDCTNFGCIPSKSLIASAHAASALKESKSLGVEFPLPPFNANPALERTRTIVAEVRSHEDPAALTKLGVETITGQASFLDSHTLFVNGEEIWASKIVIATGSSAFIPPLSGLDKTPYLTNESIFHLKQVPESLAVMGGGPIGCEMAQAFQRLGSKVSLIHTHEELLNREEKLTQETIAKQFEKEGIALHLGVHVTQVNYANDRFQIALDNGKTVDANALLVSVGRRPNLAALNLKAAGVTYSDKGITTDAYGRTNKHHIWAIGDAAGAPFFTHRAENQARSVLTSLLLPFKKKLDQAQAVPRVTFTDPEVASAGLTEELAAKKYKIAAYVVPFSVLDRAITASRTEGFVKVVTKKWSSQILGFTIVGPRAGEMLGELSLAMHAKIPLRKLASLIHPFPTYNQAIRKAADLWLTQTILGVFRRAKK
ncbi:MAG: FAD-dependent oxidoreductase [Verrucomicrobia bacterium]|nr:FAD-dependent oxidoreductase [Verrucomicrobiota bacterium]